MRVEIAQLHQRLVSTMIYVSHDQVEAMTMADRIVVSSESRPGYEAFVAMRVDLVENLGTQTLICASMESGQPITMLVEGQVQPQTGEEIQTYARQDLCHFFDKSGRAIG